MKPRNLVFFILVPICTLSCIKDKGTIDLSTILTTPDSCNSNISFSKQIIPIINTSCAIPQCHVSGVPDVVDFTIPANIIMSANSGDMKNRINGIGSNTPMPKGVTGGLPSCEKAKITAWINAGALNN